MSVTYIDEQIGFGNEYKSGEVIPSFYSQIFGVPQFNIGPVYITFEYFGDFDIGDLVECVAIDIEGIRFGPYVGPQYNDAFGAAAPITVNFTIDQAEWSRIVADGIINIGYILGSSVNNLSDAPNAEEFFRTTFTWEANRAPSFAIRSELNIAENQFGIAQLTAIDPEGDSLTYRITGGDDAALFSVDARTGMLSFIRAPDFEAPGSASGSNEYQVRVEVSDGSLTDSELFTVSVTDSDDQKVGTIGNDVFHAGTAFEHFFGGDGFDRVVFTGSRDDYTIDVQPDGTITVASGNGVDTLNSIERLLFRDGTLAFDVDGTAGQVFRLYQAVFGREPDAEGLGYWVWHQDNAKSSFQDVARSFMASPEFEHRYGSEVSSSAFLKLLYQNVLGREPDADGFAYWTEKLDSGQTNHGDLLAFFSDSRENIVGTADGMSEGMWLA